MIMDDSKWPSGCHDPDSCHRHMCCMYMKCRWKSMDIRKDIEAAVKAVNARLAADKARVENDKR